MLLLPLHRFRLTMGLVFLTCSPLLAQFDTEGAQVISYFPHLADGGPPSQKWTTSLTFVNPHGSIAANALLALYGDDGGPLALDFGGGAASKFTFTVPPQGTVTFTSTAVSPVTVTGWAAVASTTPLQGVIQFRFSSNGIPQQGVSAQSTAASQQFRSPATAVTGIAIANPYSSYTLGLTVSALDGGGKVVATSAVTVGPMAHRSFTVSQIFPGLSTAFRGSVAIFNSTTIAANFVVWTLSSDSGVLSSYPPSGLNWPVSQYERIWKVWQKVLNASGSLVSFGTTPPSLVVDFSTDKINSFAAPAQNEVHIFMNLAELISDSESELSFVVAHELGHIIQARIGKLVFVPSNIEFDADQYGMLLSLVAGYDPYGAAGALAKLAMASGDAALLNQNFDNLVSLAGIDPHGSFNNRLAVIFASMQQMCTIPQAQNFCAQYKGLIHPHLPPIAPLSKEGPGGQ